MKTKEEIQREVETADSAYNDDWEDGYVAALKWVLRD